MKERKKKKTDDWKNQKHWNSLLYDIKTIINQLPIGIANKTI